MIPYFANREIILASASPRRLDLLRQIGVTPRVCPVEVAESSELTERGPGALVRKNALAKARAARTARVKRSGVIIGADTVVVLDNQLFGKPHSSEEATAMLRELSGREHSVYTGICLIDTATGHSVCGSRRTRVRFAALTEEQIEAYVATGEPLDKAGGYGIQGAGALLVESIKGDYGTVVGLSLPLLAKLTGRLMVE